MPLHKEIKLNYRDKAPFVAREREMDIFSSSCAAAADGGLPFHLGIRAASSRRRWRRREDEAKRRGSEKHNGWIKVTQEIK